MPKTAHTSPGDILADLRAKLGLSQQQLADRAGIDRRSVSAVERGLNKLSSYGLRGALRRALSLSAEELDQLLDGRLSVDAAARLFKGRGS